jgi:two-component system, LytTR family, response regulator
MAINTIIIEDEEPARNLIKNFLSEIEEINILCECSDGFEGVKAINELKPDLIIMDIQMPRLTGFEVVELIEHKPEIIFSTAYDQYAIKAFEFNAIDYLLKPYTKDRFSQAINKAVSTINSKDDSSAKKINSLVNNAENISNEYLYRIAIKTGIKIIVLPSSSIQYIEADGDYVKIHTKETSYLKEKTMKYFETHLSPSEFIRIHRSYIVNINEIARIEQFDKENHVVILKKGDTLKTSTGGYKLLKQALSL